MEKLKNFIHEFRQGSKHRARRDEELPVAVPSSLQRSGAFQKMYSQNEHSQNDKTWTLSEKLVVGTLGVAVLGVSVWLGNRYIKAKLADKEENKTFEEGSNPTLAKQIRMAFEND
jgi:hypothetical protein